MKMSLLNKVIVCVLTVIFLAGSVYAGTTGSNTTTKKKTTPPKTTTKKTSPFDEKKDQKKDKTTPIPQAGWNGTINIANDASNNPIASFSNDQDKKQYNIQIDEAAKKMLANIKTGSKVTIKGSVIVKADGKKFVKLTECAALPGTPPQPES